ncbi:hypothetical protein BXU10_21300 [Flavobacterium sp. LM4]|nr:hypothetical protein BXU10_21300 [Flavobacterium sp. LM4]
MTKTLSGYMLSWIHFKIIRAKIGKVFYFFLKICARLKKYLIESLIHLCSEYLGELKDKFQRL